MITRRKKYPNQEVAGLSARKWIPFIVALGVMISACSTEIQTKRSQSLEEYAENQTLAILPVQSSDKVQTEIAGLFRHSLHAHLKNSKYNILERHVVNGLLKKNNLKDPAKYLDVNPMRFGEILGADAVIITRINRVRRTYFVIHSSIEVDVSLQMVDTRTGEILWRAEQTESEYQGLGRIPTGLSSAVIGPVHLVTNKFNLQALTSRMAKKLSESIIDPVIRFEDDRFEEVVIARAAREELTQFAQLNKPATNYAVAKINKRPTQQPHKQSQARPVVKAAPRALPQVHAKVQNPAPPQPAPGKPAVQHKFEPVETAALVKNSRKPVEHRVTPPAPDVKDPLEELENRGIQEETLTETETEPVNPIPPNGSAPKENSRPDPLDQLITFDPESIENPFARPNSNEGPMEKQIDVQELFDSQESHNKEMDDPSERTALSFDEDSSIVFDDPRQGTQVASVPAGTASKALYTVQVGAYKTQENADRMNRSLRNKGYNAFTSSSSIGKSQVYRVQIEQFNNREQADQYSNKLKTQENMNNFVTTLSLSQG